MLSWRESGEVLKRPPNGGGAIVCGGQPDGDRGRTSKKWSRDPALRDAGPKYRNMLGKVSLHVSQGWCSKVPRKQVERECYEDRQRVDRGRSASVGSDTYWKGWQQHEIPESKKDGHDLKGETSMGAHRLAWLAK